jgi:adenylyl cyclase-associated protein
VTAASECKKIPTSDPSYLTLLKPTQESLMAVAAVKDKKRPRDSKEQNSVTQVAEGIPALAWVTLDAKPAAFVGDMKDSATFYTNRVIKEFKDR